MNKIQVVAVLWTLFLAGPFIAIALTALAYLTDNKIVLTLFPTLSESMTVRLPELLGILMGQAVITLTLLVLKQQYKRTEKLSR